MYTYEKFYDHFVIKKDNEILYHVDSESEAKKDIFLLKSENIDSESININEKNYTVYHLHSTFSLLDSTTNYRDYIDYACKLGQKAICFTEHGNLYSWANKWMYARSKGLKYMIGAEFYLTETLEEKIRDNYHTILIAKNTDGLKELFELNKISTKDKTFGADCHVYYKNRITFEEFLNISDNIIKISACLQSPLWKYWNKVDNNECYYDNGSEWLDKLLKHYDYYEIQYHNNPEQIAFNKRLYEASKKYNKPLIAGTDTHSLNQYKAECRTLLQYGKTDRDWGNEENECDLTYKTYTELIDMFRVQNSLPMDVVLEAIENTNKMADTVVDDYDIDTKTAKYPILYGDKDEEVMWDRINNGYKEKVAIGEIEDNPQYLKNAEEEMRVFKKTNMIGFMLSMSLIVKWAKDNDIAVGFARGSCSGSTVAYLTDITDVDPVIRHTVFSRFCNEDRVELGDIDCDFYEDDRPKIYKHIIDTFGEKKTSYIVAFGTLADKSVIDVIGKAFSVMYNNGKRDRFYSLKEIADIKKQWDKDKESTREKYKDIFYFYDGLVGCEITQSMHPAGIVVSSVDITPFCGNFYGENKLGETVLISNIDMEECHDLNLVKYDILGLKSVGVIDKTLKMIGKKFPKAYQVDWNDEAVFNDITNDSTMLFQFESDFAKSSIKKMKPKSVEDICLCSACIRPSGESYREKVFAHEWNKNPSKLIDDILSNSYGYLCIDENQLMPTTNGIKKIKDINVGDNVFTHNGINNVNKVYNNGIKDVYKITTSNGSISCTDNHPILTQYGWVKAKDIIKNPDEYCIAIKTNDCGNINYNKDLLKILAWLIGDGILHQNGSQKNHLAFVNTNEKVIEEFCNSVEKIYGDLLTTNIIEKQTRVNKYPIYYVKVNWKQPYVMRGNEKPIVSFLKECNVFDTLAQNKELPAFLFNLNKDSILTFLGAYTDTDCHIDKNSLTYHCSSYNLLLGVQELYRKIGFSSCLKENNKEKDYTLSITNAKNALYLLKNYSIVVKQSDFGLCKNNNNMAKLLPKNYVINNIITNKQECFIINGKKLNIKNQKYVGIELLKRIKADKKYSNIIKFNEYVSNEDINWAKIKDVSFVGKKNVYDLEINNVHDFALCGGFIVHNCYQEQTIAFLQQVCGFSGSEADNIRRAIGQKNKEKIAKALPKILDGYCNKSNKPRSVAEKEAKQFIKIIEDASSYSFGFNHSESYAMLTYLMGWLRYYYPTEFCTAYLNCAKNDEDLSNGTIIAKNRNCTIQNPKFGISTNNYGCDSSTKTIYKGVSSIKGMQSVIGDELYRLSQKKKYNNFLSLLFDIKTKTSCNKTSLDILIKLDYFSDFGDINYLLNCVKLYDKFIGKGNFGKTHRKQFNKKTYDDLHPIFQEAVDKFTTEKSKNGSTIYVSEKNIYKMVLYLSHKIKYKPTTLVQHAQYEAEILNYVSTIDKDSDEWIVTNVEINQYGTPYVSLYRLCDGYSNVYKTNKKWYNEYKIDVGDSIKPFFEEKRKKVKEDNKWVDTNETYIMLSEWA